MTQNQKTGLIVAIVIILGVGLFFGLQYKRSHTPTPISDNGSVPDLNRPIPEESSIPTTIRADIEARIRGDINSLKADANNLTAWIDLGLQRKALHDYEGARQAWEYASIIRPKNSLSFGNLGDLYAYYIKDSVKAEQNFLTAIENDKNLIYLYFQASDFYRDVLKDLTKARAILKEGAKNIPSEAENFNKATTNF